MSKENKMTKLEAYNEVVSAIRRAEYVDSVYADAVETRALKVCEKVLCEQIESEKAVMTKTAYRKGDKITSFDELARQEFIYDRDRLVHHGWFMSWQIRMTMIAMQRGVLRYAIKTHLAKRKSEDEKDE